MPPRPRPAAPAGPGPRGIASRPAASARDRAARTARARRRGLAASLAGLVLVLLSAAADQAAAQGVDLDGLFGRGPAPAPAAEAPAPAPERDRPPELAAYGALTGYEPEETMVRRTTETVSVFRQRMDRLLREAPRGWSGMIERLETVSPDGTAGYFAGVALVTVVLVMIGRGVVTLVAVYGFLPLMVRAQRGPPPRGISGKLPVLALRMGITVVGVAINAGVALSLGLVLMESHQPTQLTALVILASYALFMLVDTSWRMALSPYLTLYRIPELTDTQARGLYLGMAALAGFGITTHAYTLWMREIGLSRELVALNELVFALGAMLLALWVIWRNRVGVTRAILRGRELERSTWIARLGARIWLPAATLYVVAAGIEEGVRTVLGLDKTISLLAGLFLTLMLGLVVYAVGIYAVERIFARSRMAAALAAETAAADRAEAASAAAEARAAAEDGALPAPAGLYAPAGGEGADADGDDEGAAGSPPRAPAGRPAPPAGRAMTTYEQLAGRVVSLFALGAAGWALVWIWAGDAAFADGALIDVLQDTLDTLFVGYVLYHAARIWLDRKIAEETADLAEAEPGDEGGGGTAASRLGTLLPLFRSAILATIGLSVAVLVAVEFGLNVAPLFAGAGVVGLAVGFGAQTLVRDILSGTFFLLDDAFRKGEYIDVGQVKGVVEKISLRSFQLRHHLGALHTIPFGEIQHLTNFSRDWVMMKLPLRVTYDTDVDKVRKLIKTLGAELLAHPTEGPKFMQPLKSQGVYMMDDSAMIIRVKYMTRPGDQWTTRKLVYQRIREIFEAEGIKFAHREVTVRLPDLPEGRRLSDEERSAVGAAARRAVDDADGPAPTPLAAVEGR